MDPFDDNPQDGQHWRKNAKWLHAGVFPDINRVVWDIYYAFRRLEEGSYRIRYALDKNGKSLGNLNVGRMKYDLITWDDHHVRKWIHFLTACGTWKRKMAEDGRKAQRATLLENYLDPNSHDPPKIRRAKAIGPPLNIIHHEDDTFLPAVSRLGRQAGLIAINFSLNSSLNSSMRYYPDSKIPLSLADIKVGVYMDEDRDPLKVISNFLTGRMSANPSFPKFRQRVIDRVESAFFELGWRANRIAIGEASDIVHQAASSAFESDAWKNWKEARTIIKVDRFKGDTVANLMRKVRGDVDLQDDDLQDDSDDEEDSSEKRPPFGRDTGPRGTSGGGSSARPSFHVDSDDSDDEDDPFAPDAQPVARATGSQVATGGRSSARPNFHAYVQDDSDEEEDLFVSQRPSVARATGGRRSAGSDSLENALLWDMRGNSRPVAPAQDSDDDSYLSDRSPRKGKAPASRKHRMKKGKDRDDSPPKRIKTEEPITIDDSDNEIDKDKSSRKAIKAESDVEIDEEKSTPAAIKAETIDLTQVADLEIDDARSSLPAVKAEPIDLSQNDD